MSEEYANIYVRLTHIIVLCGTLEGYSKEIVKALSYDKAVPILDCIIEDLKKTESDFKKIVGMKQGETGSHGWLKNKIDIINEKDD